VTLSQEPRQRRLSSGLRGLIIGALVLAFGWFTKQAEASLTQAFLVGAALQLAVILLRKFVPAEQLPQAQALFELLVDAATVLAFALGVYGGMLRVADNL